MKRCSSCLTGLALLSVTCRLAAFDGHRVTEGPLTVTIEALPKVTNYHSPQTVLVTLSNSGPASLETLLKLTGLLKEFRALGPTNAVLVVPAGSLTNATFTIAADGKVLSALYPVKVDVAFQDKGVERRVQAVRIFETALPQPIDEPKKQAVIVAVPEDGSLDLCSLRSHQVHWQYFGKNLEGKPPGWEGSDETSLTFFARGNVNRGEARASLQVHPPYKGGAGTAFVDYQLKLPSTTPLRLTFYNAIRDSTEKEGSSDGVTFRVWVDGESVFERTTASKTWVQGQADLARFAGRDIVLRLENHPGPRSNTVCDLSYWGDPVVTAGRSPRVRTNDEASRQQALARESLRSGKPAEPSVRVLSLESPFRAVLVPGPNGIADCVLGFGTPDRAVLFTGLEVTLAGRRLGVGESSPVVDGIEFTTNRQGRLVLAHRVKIGGQTERLDAEIWPDGPGLRLKISSPAPITDLAPGPTDQKATKLYYGHGYCLVDPGRFQAGSGGHNLSASHIGLEFNGSPSVLIACDTPPDHLFVDGQSHRYGLHTHPDSTFTFVPGTNGAFDSAFRYRPLYDKPAAPALAAKAGRFVFDLWGGRYRENTDLMRRCFDYGVTNSLAMLHVWQRWGYDYRLPDIWPPLPSLGTLEDLREFGETCRAAGALWGLHDNYIDIYPDALGFSYDLVTFNADGQPRKAWFNEGRKAQSYQFRPDRVRPFLERNLDWIQPALKPTSSFVDVWTSINAFDFYDREGRFHSKTETLECWGAAFNLIRNKLGNAPTVSEAGSDQLIGRLEGADCQFLRVSTGGESFTVRAPCADWERVPWFDAVNHRRFSLHGVGYSGRYQGGLSREAHGIQSDDYLSAEILTGHALMVERSCGVRGAVRKYWLAQDFVESIALDDIVSVQFADGDIHRLVIAWRSGARVHVNRGTNDWAVAGKVLPPYGFSAHGRDIQTSIHRIGGVTVEESHRKDGFYVNARNAAQPVDFGAVKTTGAVRITTLGKHTRVIPLPGHAGFEVALKLPPPEGRVGSTTEGWLESIDARGKPTGKVTFERDSGRTRFTAKPADFGYLWNSD